MAMANTCWECENNSLELKVLVPPDRTVKEYVHCTSNFQSNIVAVVKEKPGQYTVWFRSEGDIKLVSFKMMHVCKLKIQPNQKQPTCPCYRQKEEHNLISNIIYSKPRLQKQRLN